MAINGVCREKSGAASYFEARSRETAPYMLAHSDSCSHATSYFRTATITLLNFLALPAFGTAQLPSFHVSDNPSHDLAAQPRLWTSLALSGQFDVTDDIKERLVADIVPEANDLDTETTGIEEIVVLGSRARMDTLANELPVGADVFQGADVERAGESDLGAALTKLAPSFNSSRQSIGDGALFRAATLRGLSPDQTLVLVNGKRRHSMAWLRVLDGVIGYGSGGTDLAAIPTTALGRIEVLRDGAAAQYGSDAIAGVINLQLRDHADGGEFTVHGGTGDGNGSRVGAAFNGGLPLGNDGFLNVTAEWYKEDPLHRNGGNGGLDPDFQDRLITDSSPLNDSAFVFLNAALATSDTSEFYAFGGLSRRTGRASGAYRFRYGYWDGLESGDDTWDFVVPNFVNFHERNTHPVYPNGFLPYEESRIDDASAVVGWRSAISGWDLDLSAGYGRNEYGFGVSDTINASIGAHYLDRNPGASVANVIANAGPLDGDSGGIEFDQLTLNLDVRRTFEAAR